MIDVLPNELLLTAFEWILLLDDPTSAYTTLCNASLVCKRWSDAARRTLITNVEISRTQDCSSLLSLLARFQSLPSPPSIETLTVAVGGPREFGLIDDAIFLHLLSLSPRLRKLTLLHTNSMGCLPEGVLPLPLLTDVTITSAGTAPAPATEATLIQRLPPSVKVLSLPGSERTRFVDTLTPPEIQLEKLSIQDFPTASSKWVLTHSQESLRALSVVYLSDVAQVPSHVQSLKVLGRLSNSAAASGFGSLQELEDLEIRDPSLKASLADSLPSSLRRIRFWSESLATGLVGALSRGELPNLERLTWDYHSAPSSAVEAMQRLCLARGIKLVALERRDAGRRVLIHHDAPSTKLPSRALKGMVTSSVPLAPHFKSISPFMNSIAGTWAGIWEECFEGHGVWLEERLPALMPRKTPLPTKPMMGGRSVTIAVR